MVCFAEAETSDSSFDLSDGMSGFIFFSIKIPFEGIDTSDY